MMMTLLQANYMSLFNWVLTTSAKASIFIVFLLGVKYVLRHRMGARFQYMLWSVLIIALVLPWAPSSPVSINNLVNSSYLQQVLAASSNSTTQPTATIINNKQSSIEQTAVVNSNSSKAVLGADTQLTGNSNNVAPFAIFPFIYKLMFLIWLVGMLLLTAITVLVNIRFSNKIEHNLVTDPRLITVFNQLKVELKIKAEIPLVKTRHVNGPALLGFMHPRLLLPLGIEQTFSVEQIKHIFLHELLHFKRKDIMINWLTQVLVIIHWFNPLIWYAFYRMREDQEIACDALAMERIDTEQSNDYAYTLIKLVETYSNAPRLAGLASLSGSKSQIRRRITMIKDFRRNSVKWSVLGLLVIALIATAVFTSPVNQGDSEAQAVVKEYKSKLYNVSYNSISWENPIKDNDEYKQFFTQKAFGKFVVTRVMQLPRQVADNKKYNLQLKDIKFKKASSTEKNKLIFDYDLVMDILSADGSNSVENEIGQVTLVKEDGQWKIDNDWFNLNDTFKKGLANSAPATGNVVDTTALTVKYLKDHGYSIANATGGGNLAGAKIQLPNSFNAVINEVKIGELLKEKNELSKRDGLDFSKYLGQKVSIMTWGLDATANSPNGSDVFFLIYDDNIVGVWFDPNKYGEKNMTLSILENILKV